jgi:hypothetical protein
MRAIPGMGGRKMDDIICEKCKGNNFGTFVQYGSWIVRCVDCKACGPVTSFIAIHPHLAGHYHAVEVDEELQSKGTIFEGDIKEGLEVIKAEAQKGKMIQLQRVV